MADNSIGLNYEICRYSIYFFGFSKGFSSYTLFLRGDMFIFMYLSYFVLVDAVVY